MRRFLFLAGAFLLAALLLAMVATMGFTDRLDRQFVYFPTKEIERTPADAGLAFEEVYFTADDGVRLHGWHLPAQQVPAGPGKSPSAIPLTLLWFHGNGGNLGHRVDDLAFLNRRLGVNILIFDYRGYGKSQGRPAEAGLYRDARAALHYLSTRPDVDPAGIVYLGRSLGTAVAVELASNYRRPAGVILVSPLTSLGDMARFAHPVLPLHWLAGNRFNTLSRVGLLDAPLLVIHSRADETVPYEQGRRIFEAAKPPKQFLELPAAGHNDGFAQDGAAIHRAFADFLASLPR